MSKRFWVLVDIDERDEDGKFVSSVEANRIAQKFDTAEEALDFVQSISQYTSSDVAGEQD